MIRWTWVSLAVISQPSNSLIQTRDIQLPYFDIKYENVLDVNNREWISNQSDKSNDSIHDAWKTSNDHNHLQKDNCKLTFDYRNPLRHLMKLKGTVKVNANCALLFERNIRHARLIHITLKKWKNTISDGLFMDSLTSNCSSVFNDFVNSFYVSKMEMEFPIAFEMLIYYKPVRIQQYIRLLKNIYRPQNVYCIHIDKKAPQWWSQSLKDFANCFPNVIIARNPLNVVYASSAILYAHFKCFHELLESKRDWKYVISLHGTEIPLVTNRQMVEVLRKINGSNIVAKGVEAVKYKNYNSWLTHKAVPLKNNVRITKEKLGPIPYNISVYKSAASANSALSKEFVNFIFTDKRALAFAKYLDKVKTAVEFFFSTINLFPDAPGGLHTLPRRFKMPLIAQRDWMISKSQFMIKGFCEGHKIVNSMCIVSIRDLPRLQKASENMSWWFHNKYFIEYDHIVMDCIEKLLIQRNVKEHESDCSLQ